MNKQYELTSGQQIIVSSMQQKTLGALKSDARSEAADWFVAAAKAEIARRKAAK